MDLNTILIAIAAVFLVMYLMRRRSRLRSDD
jgi:hypothetical protein